MTLVDSADSILMLYSYTGFAERSFVVFSSTPERIHRRKNNPGFEDLNEKSLPIKEDSPHLCADIGRPENSNIEVTCPNEANDAELGGRITETNADKTIERDTRVKMNVMSGLSIILTLMSILVAFR